MQSSSFCWSPYLPGFENPYYPNTPGFGDSHCWVEEADYNTHSEYEDMCNNKLSGIKDPETQDDVDTDTLFEDEKAIY